MTVRQGVSIIGAGGHAKVVAASVLDGGGAIAALFDSDPARVGDMLLGHAIELQPDRSDLRGGAILAIGDNAVRRRLAGELAPEWWETVVHPRAYVHESARIGRGVLICAGAIVQPGAVIGDHAIINTGAIVEHDCRVGDYAHIAPGACLGGAAQAGEGAFIGLGAKVLPLIKAGDWSVVGAGAAVTRGVAAGATMAGVPARLL